MKIKIITTNNDVLWDAVGYIFDTNAPKDDIIFASVANVFNIHEGEYIILNNLHYVVYCIVKNLDDNSIIVRVEPIVNVNEKIIERIFGK